MTLVIKLINYNHIFISTQKNSKNLILFFIPIKDSGPPPLYSLNPDPARFRKTEKQKRKRKRFFWKFPL